MTLELTYLVWTLILAIAQIVIAASLGTMDAGMPYAAGPRDNPPSKPYSLLTGRMQRAQKNLFETLPLFIAAILIAHVSNHNNAQTALGAELYFWARVAYVPAYAVSLPFVRTLTFVVSMAGLVLVLAAIV